MLRDDVILVARARADAGNEAFPDAGRPARISGWLALVPAVEVADDGDVACAFGRPDGEVGAGLTPSTVRRVGAELVVQAEVAALVEQVQVVRRQQRVRGTG